MYFYSIYSKNIRLLIRFLFSIFIILSISSNIRLFLIKTEVVYLTFFSIQDIITVILSFLILVKPSKSYYISFIDLMFSYSQIVLYSNITIGITIFLLGISILFISNYFKTHKILKSLLLIAILIFSGVLSSFCIFKVFFPCLIDKMEYIIIYSSSLLFIVLFSKTNYVSAPLILNIAKYNNLSQRDAEWLELIQKKEKYDLIAINYKMSIGTVKNRFKIIFDELDVKNKSDFISKYSKYKIVYLLNENKKS